MFNALEYINHLCWWQGEFHLQVVDGIPPPGQLGGIVHGTLCSQLRILSCITPNQCKEGCRNPSVCTYGRLVEPVPPKGDNSPLHGISHVPSPLVVSLRSFESPVLLLRIRLLGSAGRDRNLVSEAMDRGLEAGWGRKRQKPVLQSVTWARKSLACSQGASLVEVRFHSPVRLIHNKKLLNQVEPGVLVRNLMLRVSAWGHFHQGLPWPEPWPEVLKEAGEAEIRNIKTQLQSVSRYSARQKARLVTRGLIGSFDLVHVGPSLLALLQAGEVVHAGKGASMGMGDMRITVCSGETYGKGNHP